MSSYQYNLLIKNVGVLFLFYVSVGCKNTVSQDRPNQIESKKAASVIDSSIKIQSNVDLHQDIAKSLPQSDWSVMNLRGNVRILKVLNYNAIKNSSGEIVKGDPTDVPIAYSFSARFNSNGFMTSKTDYDFSHHKAYRTHVYNYDQLHRLSSINTVFFHLEDPRIQKFNYDDKGNLVETTFFEGDYLTSKETFTFDSRNRQVSKLDSPGNNIPYIYKYDDKDNLTDILYYIDHKLSSHYQYEYDKLNRRTKTHRIYSFNPKKEIIELYSYNSYGDVIELILPLYVYNNSPSTLRTEYIYDERGNWIRSIHYHPNGDPEFWTEREISYY